MKFHFLIKSQSDGLNDLLSYDCFCSVSCCISSLLPTGGSGVIFNSNSAETARPQHTRRVCVCVCVFIVRRLLFSRVSYKPEPLCPALALPSPCGHVFLELHCVSSLDDTCFPPSDPTVDKLHTSTGCVCVSVPLCVCVWTD